MPLLQPRHTTTPPRIWRHLTDSEGRPPRTPHSHPDGPREPRGVPARLRRIIIGPRRRGRLGCGGLGRSYFNISCFSTSYGLISALRTPASSRRRERTPRLAARALVIVALAAVIGIVGIHFADGFDTGSASRASSRTRSATASLITGTLRHPVHDHRAAAPPRLFLRIWRPARPSSRQPGVAGLSSTGTVGFVARPGRPPSRTTNTYYCKYRTVYTDGPRLPAAVDTRGF